MTRYTDLSKYTLPSTPTQASPGPNLADEPREHVYRNHDVPYCQRCHATFINPKALEEHLRAAEACVLKEGPLGHLGITPEQRVQLKSRRRGDGDANQTEEDKWIKVYLLLFSDVPRAEVPSPCEFYLETPFSIMEWSLTTYSDYDLKKCEEGFNPAAVRQFLQEDVPVRVTRQLEERRLNPGNQSVQEQLPSIIRDCVGQAWDNLPPRLFAPQDQPSPVPAPQQPSMTDAPASQNTAQIGAQFAVVEPEPTAATTQDQTVAGVAMGGPVGLAAGDRPTNHHTDHHTGNQMGLTAENLTQLPSTPSPPNWPLRDFDFENPFNGVWFPDPLEDPGQPGLGNGGGLNGFQGFNFNLPGENMPVYNMPNEQFLHRGGFPPDHNNKAFGHDPNQQRNYYPG
jgi:hypothetical protein